VQGEVKVVGWEEEERRQQLKGGRRAENVNCASGEQEEGFLPEPLPFLSHPELIGGKEVEEGGKAPPLPTRGGKEGENA